jgi:cytoskeletal protein CcmA (bactofilin family)
VLKKFLPQKPSGSPENSAAGPNGAEESSIPPHREETPKPAIMSEYSKNMAENIVKDILSKDVEIKGSIKFQREMMIDGKVEGEIHSDGVLTIGENADIRGEIKTKSITVFGKVHGNITVTERCELKSRSTLQGDLKAARLVIEEGATFIGKSEVTSGKMSAAPAGSNGGTRQDLSRNDETLVSSKAAFAGRG